MNHLVLTGIATELDVASGSTSFALVFNGGNFRIPISEEGASEAINSLTAEDPNLTHEKAPNEEWGASAHPTQPDAEDLAAMRAEDIQAQAEAGENHGDFYVNPTLETGPSEEDIAAAIAAEAGQAWQSPNGQLQMDPAINGAEIFSATDDDYAQPPDQFPSMAPPETGADDINDGVAQL